MKKVLRHILIHNLSGLTYFITIWSVGVAFWLATLVGLMSPVDNWILLKVPCAASVSSFCFFPVCNFLFGKTF